MQPLKFGNEYVILSYTLMGMWLLIHAGIWVSVEEWYWMAKALFVFPKKLCIKFPIQWNMGNQPTEVLLKTHQFCYLPCMDTNKWCLFSLSWKTTCLERPYNSGFTAQASWQIVVTRAVKHAGIANSRFPLKSVVGKMFPEFPAHAWPAILCIW